MTRNRKDPPGGRRPSFMPFFLGLVFLLFVAILLVVYVETRKANPVILDEKGAPR